MRINLSNLNKFILFNFSQLIYLINNQTLCETKTNIINKNNYSIIQKIDNGFNSQLFKAINALDKSIVMIKELIPNNNKNENILNEINILQLIEKYGNHKNIMRYNNFYIYHNKYYLITEYIDGKTLYDKLYNNNINIKTAIKIMYEITLAILFLHTHNIIHNDIKPENIIIKNDLTVKLIDFGSAIDLNNNINKIDKSYTKIYASPELLLNNDLNFGLDMWSLGCIFYILLSGRHPFDPFGKLNEEQIINNIINQKVSFIYPEFNNISNNIKEIILKLLEKDQIQRINILELLFLLEQELSYI